jgi:hypothetical protein
MMGHHISRKKQKCSCFLGPRHERVSFFTQETGTPCARIILEVGRHKPYKALVSFFPAGTLVVGHHDLSTGGVAETTPMRAMLASRLLT